MLNFFFFLIGILAFFQGQVETDTSPTNFGEGIGDKSVSVIE